MAGPPKRRRKFTRLDAVSALVTRYHDEDLDRSCLSGRAEIWYQARVERAAVRELHRMDRCTDEQMAEVEQAVKKLSAEAVVEEENRVQHNIRALVNCLQALCSPATRPKIHAGETSFDIIDTANAWRVRDALQRFVLPMLIQLFFNLVSIAQREAGTIQIGRSHGQHAVPITFGFAISGYVYRLGERIEKLMAISQQAPGMVSGAVGAYNATLLLHDDPVDFEARVLASINLKQVDHSTQILPPEWTTDVMHYVISTLGVIAGLADDMRHLQRTEIAEVGEVFDASQVGSSTMPHKRNPWNWENIKSLWKKFMPHMITVYMDQLSEHQRDLTNSASGRFNVEPIEALMANAKRATRITSKLVTDSARMRQNVKMTGDMCASEPLQVILSALGHPDAHEYVRQLTLEAQKSNPPNLLELFWADQSVADYRGQLTPHQVAVLKDPEKYIGLSYERTHAVCDKWFAIVTGIQAELSRINRINKSLAA